MSTASAAGPLIAPVLLQTFAARDNTIRLGRVYIGILVGEGLVLMSAAVAYM